VPVHLGLAGRKRPRSVFRQEAIAAESPLLSAESSHALIKRGLIVYLSQCQPRIFASLSLAVRLSLAYRQLNDGERTVLAAKAAEGKRLMYKDPLAERDEQKEGAEQLKPF